jgi:uncharacterized membrane-anchored protein
MKLSKHKLPKISNKVKRTAKHKDSAVKKLRVEEKNNKMVVEEKNNKMVVDNSSDTTVALAVTASEEDKEQAKRLRKRSNAHRVSYKKNNYNMTSRHGPRAVSGHSVGTVSLR